MQTDLPIPTEDMRGTAANARLLEAWARALAANRDGHTWQAEADWWQAEAERRERAEASA